MTRTDRAHRVVKAAPAAVHRALLDKDALEAWLPPEGMRGHIDVWDPRPGGKFRMTLAYADPAANPGKTGEGGDVVEVVFADIVEPELVVHRAVFESDEPDFAGTMTMTWRLTPVDGGTEVTVLAEDVPPGIVQSDHEEAMASSLANLAAHVEAAG